jgi:SAF domain
VGVVLLITSLVVALTIYTRVGDRRQVLMTSRDVLAGEQLTADDVRVVAVASDDAFRAVPVDERATVVGKYAKVRMLSGTLLAAESLQDRPLVDPSKALVTVLVPAGSTPVGLREGSRLLLTVVASQGAPVMVEGFATSLPTATGSGASTMSLSVEVPVAAASSLGTASRVAVSVLDPSAALPAGTIS